MDGAPGEERTVEPHPIRKVRGMDGAHESQSCEEALALGLAACCLLDLGLVLSARAGAWTLGRSGLACCALDLLALDFIGDAGCICHE